MYFKQFLALALVAFTLTACSKDKPSTELQNGDMMDGTMNGANAESMTGDIVPGTYADLVANVGDRIFFDFNSAALTSSAQDTLRRQAEWMQQYPNATATIEGHCDERGTREYNLALGERRANAVKNFLVSLGVNASRVNTISYGKEHPEYPGSDEASWSKNRRGVTVIN